MRQLIIPIQFIVVMGCMAFHGYAGQPKESIINSLGIKFVLIKPAGFLMGSPEIEPGRYTGERLHPVNLTNPFYMQTTEATTAQWKALMDDNPSSQKRSGSYRVMRGGVWYSPARVFRSASGLASPPHYRFRHIDFRFFRTP